MIGESVWHILIVGSKDNMLDTKWRSQERISFLTTLKVK